MTSKKQQNISSYFAPKSEGGKTDAGAKQASIKAFFAAKPKEKEAGAADRPGGKAVPTAPPRQGERHRDAEPPPIMLNSPQHRQAVAGRIGI